MCGRRSQRLWALPKGTPEDTETREETALREAEEETGLQLKIGRPIGVIEYQFVCSKNFTNCHKKVYYFLMEPIGGNTDSHDEEFDVVSWFSIRDAAEKMSFQNEVEIVKKGMAMVEGQS